MFWAFRYKHSLWKKYNYLLAAALDTGLNLSILLIFLFFSAGKTVNFPEWWGNNGKSVEMFCHELSVQYYCVLNKKYKIIREKKELN